MIFSDATQADVPALISLVNAAYRAPGERPGWTDERDLLEGQRTDAGAMAEDLRSGRVLVARSEADGPIVACVHLAEEADGAWYVGTLAVDASRQGAGTGAAMLAEIEKQAREAAVPALRMTVIRQRGALIAWYERRGFARTGETKPFPYDDPRVGHPLRDDLMLVVLEKPL